MMDLERLSMFRHDYAGLILASQSPRRKDLLELAGLSFETFPSPLDEDRVMARLLREGPSLDHASLAEQLALAKARSVLELFPRALVLASDTIVTLEGQIFGKPRDKDEARSMLCRLAGRTHVVDTGVALVSSLDQESFSSSSQVTFRPLTKDLEALIDRYTKTGLPLDKAGAYGIQELGGLLIEKIEGDFFSVMGLPIGEVYARLQVRQGGPWKIF